MDLLDFRSNYDHTPDFTVYHAFFLLSLGSREDS